MSREDVQRGTLKIIEWKAKLEQRNRALRQCLEQKEASLSHVQAKLQEAVTQMKEHKGELKRVSKLKDSLQEKTRSYSSQMRVLQTELSHINKAHDWQKSLVLAKASLIQQLTSERDLMNKEIEVLGSHIKEKEAVELNKSISEKSISSSGSEENELLLGKLREKETEIASFEKLIQNAKLREEGFSKRVKGLEEHIQIITNKNCRTLKPLESLSDLQADQKGRQEAKANDEKEILRLKALTKHLKMESKEIKERAESELIMERALWELSMKNVEKVKYQEISELKAKVAATTKEVKFLKKKKESLKTASEAKLLSVVKEKDQEIEGLKESAASLQTQTQELASQEQSQEDGKSIHRHSGRWSYGSRRRGSGLVLCKEEDSLSLEKPSKRMKTYQRRSLLDSWCINP